MERNTTHGRLLDEQLKHETAGLTRAGRSTHAEEWKDPEPSGEDQPDVDRMPGGTMTGGTPEGITPEEVAERSELARWLDRSVYPADPVTIVENARSNQAPEAVIERLKDLPQDQEYDNLQAVFSALGGGAEKRP